MFRAALAFMSMLVGCADSAPSVDAVVDAADAALDARGDAAVDAHAVDAPSSGTGLDGPCDPTRDGGCAGGLTCRLRGNHRGVCRPIGPLPAGAACEAEDDCGYAMTWFSDDAGIARCAIVCDVLQPQPRCKPGQACLALVGSTGICAL